MPSRSRQSRVLRVVHKPHEHDHARQGEDQTSAPAAEQRAARRGEPAARASRTGPSDDTNQHAEPEDARPSSARSPRRRPAAVGARCPLCPPGRSRTRAWLRYRASQSAQDRARARTPTPTRPTADDGEDHGVVRIIVWSDSSARLSAIRATTSVMVSVECRGDGGYHQPIETQARKSATTSHNDQGDRDPLDGPVRRPVGACTAPDDEQDDEWPAERDEGHRPEQHVGQGGAAAGMTVPHDPLAAARAWRRSRQNRVVPLARCGDLGEDRLGGRGRRDLLRLRPRSAT